MARITFENVQKQYKSVTALQPLNLVIKDGEFFAVVGPSGCGKSTVLHLVAGLEPASGGHIYFDDELIDSLSIRERDVAMVFQSYALYPHMTVAQNLAFPLEMKRMKKSFITAEVQRMAELLGLEDLLSRKPKELSGGQRQRVALGRAIIRKPKVFLMDEPLSNLDARLRIEMRGELKRLHQELKITTIYVTHDQAEALSLAERLAVIEKGRVVQCGTAEEVYHRPGNVFVAGFIGSPPINLLPAFISRRDPLEFNCSGWRISPKLIRPPLTERIIIGFRPETLPVSENPSGQNLEGKVVLVEPAGFINWVGVDWKGFHLRGISADKSRLTVGSTVFFRMPAEKLMFFDGESQNNLSLKQFAACRSAHG